MKVQKWCPYDSEAALKVLTEFRERGERERREREREREGEGERERGEREHRERERERERERDGGTFITTMLVVFPP